MTKVIINGASGRMGSESVKAINAQTNLDLIASLDSKDNLAEAIKKHRAADTNTPIVVLDFTHAGTALENTKTIITNYAYPVIGTSGLLEEQISELNVLALEFKVGGLFVPNFSIGAVLMMKFAQIAAKYYQQAEIIERHHPNKLDAPSGTAIRTAELMSVNLKNDMPHNHQSQETFVGALGAQYKNIPIHSLRLSGSVAHQNVIFGGDHETLSINHDSIHRQCFMPGVVLACQKATSLHGFHVGLETILDLELA